MRRPVSVAGRNLSVVALGMVIVLFAATLAGWWLNIGTPGAEADFGTRLAPTVSALAGVVFALVGTMIVSRRPGNAVGRVCLLIGLITVVNSASIEYSVFALLTDPGALPGGHYAAWVANWTWVFYVGLMGTVLVLVFPTGRLLSPRWRPVLALAVAGMVLAATSFALMPGPFVSLPWATNPFGVEQLATQLEVLSFGFFLVGLTIAASAVSMVLRYRRARGVERQQIKWFASAASLLAAVYVGQLFYSLITGTLGASGDSQRILQTAIEGLFGVLAASVGVAVLRYRLYQIDRVISRTVTYALVTATLGLLYVALTFALGQVVPAQSDLAIAASTLAVAALFAPVRRRIQDVVDRRFNRTRYDAVSILERFGEHLRHATDLPGLRDDLSGIAAALMEPAHVSVWLGEQP